MKIHLLVVKDSAEEAPCVMDGWDEVALADWPEGFAEVREALTREHTQVRVLTIQVADEVITGLFGPMEGQILLTSLSEDPVSCDSLHSYFIQLCDVNAFFLYQKLAPCGYVKRQGARNYFDRLNPILCRHATPKDPQGIVRL